jgi:hypothetical protein
MLSAEEHAAGGARESLERGWAHLFRALDSLSLSMFLSPSVDLPLLRRTRDRWTLALDHAGRIARALMVDRHDVLAWTVLCAALLAVGATFRMYGIAWDEQGETVYGSLLLKYYGSWFHDRSAFEFVNFRYYGGGIELPAAILARLSPFDEYATRHLLCGSIGVAGIAVTWRLARRVGGPRAGALAALLLLLSPTYYGNIFINARDVPFATGIALCLLLALRAQDELPRIRSRTMLWFGLVLGWTISVRVGGVLAILFWGVPMALWLSRRAREGATLRELARHAGHIALALGKGLLAAYAVIAVLWPWAVEQPLNLLRALTMFSRFPFDANVLFEGELIPARALPAEYLPELIVLKQSEVVLFGLAAAALMGLYALRNVRSAHWQTRSLRVAAVAFVALFPVAYFVVARPVAYNGMRHFLFVVPPLCVLSALAFDRMFAALAQPAGRYALALGIGVGCAWPVNALVELFPEQYVYFNELAGGTAGARGQFELDYWGTSLAEASRRLTQTLEARGQLPKPGQKPLKVYVCGNVWSAATFFPPSLAPVERLEDADLEIAIDTFFCPQPAGSRRVLDVTRAGALLSYVNDLRTPERAASGFAQAERAKSPGTRAVDPARNPLPGERKPHAPGPQSN